MSKILFLVVLAVYLAVCGWMITQGLHDIRVSSYRIGCMSVEAPREAIDKCKSLAEEKVGK